MAIALLWGTSISAQEISFNSRAIENPVVNADHTVSFQFYAPNAANVTISGDFLPQEIRETPFGKMLSNGQVKLAKTSEGIFSYTSPRLESDFYTYTVQIDGVQVADPNNVYMNRDVANELNYFIIPGGKGDLFEVTDVPHGNVSKVWYPSPRAGYAQRRMSVYTPAGYTAKDTKTKYS